VSSLKKGQIIAGRFRLERLLGEGGMGSVWAATHTITGKAVAVKFLKDELVTQPSVVERFLREARAACAVRHPNVVAIHDVLTLETGAPVLVMDLLEGESLGSRLAREKRLSLPDFVRIMTPVLAAVATAHAASIVHRDLKPDNVFLARGPDGAEDVKVLDFGIAKINATDQSGGQLTKTGSMLGTPYYMSPEQLFGEKDVDGRSDIWALGIIFYQCLSGVLPTEADNLGQIIKTVTVVGIPPLATVAPHVPPDLASLVDRMLSRERAGRPTLDEIHAVLARHGDSDLRSSNKPPSFQQQTMQPLAPVTAMAISRTQATGKAPGAPGGSVPPGKHDSSAPPNARALAAVVAVVGLVVFVGGGAFAFTWLKSRLAGGAHEQPPEAPTLASTASAEADGREAAAEDASASGPESESAAASSSVAPTSSAALTASASLGEATASATPAPSAPASAPASAKAHSTPDASAPAQPGPAKPTPTGTGLLEEKVPF